MNTTTCMLQTALAALLAGAAAAGPMAPPPGAISATMKPLDEVEPRTVLSAANTPGDADSFFRIDQPGSYYLTGPFTGEAGKRGIEIAADDVTVDLMGFTITGVPGSLEGIGFDGVRSNLEVRNGVVRAWAAAGIDFAEPGNIVEGGAVEDVRAVDNGGSGITTGGRFRVRDCSALRNGGTGISVSSGSVVEGCVASDNVGSGITASAESQIRGCTSRNNDGDGIYCSFGTVLDCVASTNERAGIQCVIGGSVVNCTATTNALAGIKAISGVTIRNCSSMTNIGHGIEVSSDCLVTGNQCDSNGANGVDGAGIRVTGWGNTVRDNAISDGRYGILVERNENLIVSNSVSHAGIVNYSIVAGNSVGAIFQPAASGAINGSTGGSGVGTANPWANLSF